jgi:probable O-glycosylation ligase (exosortase A-associated)
MRSLFVLSIVAYGLYRAMCSRFDALLLYLWFAFFRPQEWIWWDIRSLRLSLVIGIALTIPAALSGVWPNLSHPLSIATFLFFLSALPAHLAAFNPEVSAAWIGFLACLVLVSLLTVTLADTPRRVVMVLAVVAGSLGFHAGKAGLWALLGGGVRYSAGLAGAFADNNGYALATVMTIPLLFAVGQNIDLLLEPWSPLLRRWIKRGVFFTVLLCALTVISTFSRGGFVGLAAVAVTMTLLSRRRLQASMALAVIVIVGLAFVPFPKGYSDRISTIESYEKTDDESILGRLHYWRVALKMAEANPLGVGLRNFDYAYDTYDFSGGRFGPQRAVHNSHLEVLAEQGYFGALIWVLQFGYAFVVAYRVRARSRTPTLTRTEATFLFTTANGIIGSMTGFVVAGSFIALSLNDLTWVTFGVLASLDRVALTLCEGAKARVVAAPAALGSLRTAYASAGGQPPVIQ